ncbi:MAG: hypothetical protein LBJ92_02685 [Holosporales bacterium]|nr:hypothetical protein [Holosporales bacterium]
MFRIVLLLSVIVVSPVALAHKGLTGSTTFVDFPVNGDNDELEGYSGDDEGDNPESEESVESCAAKLFAAKEQLSRMQRENGKTEGFISQMAKQIDKIERLSRKYSLLITNQIKEKKRDDGGEVLLPTCKCPWDVIDKLCNLVFGHKIGDRRNKEKNDVEFIVLEDGDRYAYGSIPRSNSSATLTKFGISTDDEK